MHNTEALSLTKKIIFYKALLFLYPKHYRKQFGQEMLFAFQDMYQEELIKHGKIGIGFWFSILVDTIKSVAVEHVNMIQKQGVKKYLNINIYNIIGAVLLLPFFLLLGSDFLGRVIQGNFSHPNTQFYNYLSQTILYSEFQGQNALLWIILVYSPVATIVLNIVPLISQMKKKSRGLNIIDILFANPLTVTIMGLSFFFLLVAFGHDAVPCFINHLRSDGFQNIETTISICKNA